MIFSNKLEGIYHCKFLCKFKLHRLRNKRNGAAAEAKGRKNKKADCVLAAQSRDRKLDPLRPSLPRDSLPPSSVMTTTVVAGPSPSGLNTCTETRYCVKICSRWIVYFSVV